jgi:hypothetical protein
MLFRLRQVMHDPLALEILRKRLPATRFLLGGGIAGCAAGGIIVPSSPLSGGSAGACRACNISANT